MTRPKLGVVMAAVMITPFIATVPELWGSSVQRKASSASQSASLTTVEGVWRTAVRPRNGQTGDPLGVWQHVHGWQDYSFAFIDNRYDATGGFIKGQTLVVSQEIDSAVGVGHFSYQDKDVFEIPIGDFGTALVVAVTSLSSFYFKSSLTGEVYTLDDLVDNGAFFSPEYPVVTGQPLPRIPRYGIFEAATFESPNSIVLELFFDVVRETVNGAPIGESRYSITDLKVPRTKDDCKLGGWTGLGRTDGTPFKNQGDCVSYVNTGR